MDPVAAAQSLQSAASTSDGMDAAERSGPDPKPCSTSNKSVDSATDSSSSGIASDGTPTTTASDCSPSSGLTSTSSSGPDTHTMQTPHSVDGFSGSLPIPSTTTTNTLSSIIMESNKHDNATDPLPDNSKLSRSTSRIRSNTMGQRPISITASHSPSSGTLTPSGHSPMPIATIAANPFSTTTTTVSTTLATTLATTAAGAAGGAIGTTMATTSLPQQQTLSTLTSTMATVPVHRSQPANSILSVPSNHAGGVANNVGSTTSITNTAATAASSFTTTGATNIIGTTGTIGTTGPTGPTTTTGTTTTTTTTGSSVPGTPPRYATPQPLDPTRPSASDPTNSTRPSPFSIRPSLRNDNTSDTLNPEAARMASALTLDDINSFAFFRKTDMHPKRERHILYALHLKHSDQSSMASGVSGQEMMRETLDSQKDKKEKLSKRSAALSKLNALLRSKKKKRTRGGTMHNLTLAIHDRRTAYAISLIGELSLNSLKKKRPQEANKIFLYAMANRLEPVCMAMLEKGFPANINVPIFGPPNPDISKFNFPSYFFLAIALSLDGMAKSMLKLKGNVNASWYRMTPLIISCCKGNLGIVQMLVENGANTNTSLPLSYYFLLRSLYRHNGRNGPHSLAASSSRGRSSVIRGEPVNVSDFGTTFKQYGDRTPVRFSPEFIGDKSLLPIEIAAINGRKDVVKYLLPKTDVRMLAGSHFSLLAQHDVEVTLYLIKCGASLEQRDASGSTALHLAARAGKLDQIIALVLGRIDVNLTGQNDWTALHEAVGLYRKDVVQYLLKKGADRNARTSTGETPIDIARRLGFSADELEIYFERQIDDAFFKRKEDSIASMSKLIQVVNDVRSGGSGGSHSMYMSGVNGNGSGGITSTNSGRESRKSSKSSSAAGSGDGTKRKGSDKFPSLPSFLTRNNVSASGSIGSIGTTNPGNAGDQ
ncbi:hypothetical protein BASA60_001188 [Batrachochytrium salamandrivorans]|nr:hypothetical protein BASA60_001188 [Batrachochytrium salamandrivorans]